MVRSPYSTQLNTHPELLLQLLHKRLLDLLEVRKKGERHNHNNGLAAAVHLNLPCRADVQRAELALQGGVARSNVVKLGNNARLNGGQRCAVLLYNTSTSLQDGPDRA